MDNSEDKNKSDVASEDGDKTEEIVPGNEKTVVLDGENEQGADNNVQVKTCPARPSGQPTKRRPEKDLNHDNWDEEEEPEEKGEFSKATADQMKERKVLTARRKQKPAGSEVSSNPFGQIALANPFGAATPAGPTVPKFNFGIISSTKTDSELNGKDAEPSKDVGKEGESKESDIVSEPVKTCPRAGLQPTKRRPEKDLNHDNWDEEDEPEEKGEFVKANAEQMKERKVLTARRKVKPAGSEASSNPFGGIALANPFGGSTNNSFNFGAAPAKPQFNFGSSAPTTAKFDFSSVTSSKTESEEKGENKPDTPSSKKLKQ